MNFIPDPNTKYPLHNKLQQLSLKVAEGISKAESDWMQGQMRRLLPEAVFKLSESKDELELGTLRRHIVMSGIEVKVFPDRKELWQKGVPISRFEVKWEKYRVKVNIIELSVVPTPELTLLPEPPINPDSVHLREESVPPAISCGSENNTPRCDAGHSPGMADDARPREECPGHPEQPSVPSDDGRHPQ